MGSRGASSSINKRSNVLALFRDTAKINPNYSTGKWEYKNNCQSCTLAFILREKGENVVALPVSKNWWVDGNGKRITIEDMFNSNPKVNYYIVGQRRFDNKALAFNYARNHGFSKVHQRLATKNSIFTNSVDVIEQEVKKWGDGASGYVSVEWKGNKGGHVFNIKNIKGQVISIDAQSGHTRSLSNTLSKVKPQYTFITRTDNLKVNERLKKYMVKGA